MSEQHIRITPSILSADRENIVGEIAKIAAVSDLIHLDIMDNRFVPNQTWNLAEAQAIITASPTPIDAHLMVEDVDRLAIEYAIAGSGSVTIHAEAAIDISKTLRGIRSHGARSGLAVKPGTPIEGYLEFSDLVDMFLIMTVEPGFGGQKFIENTFTKVAALKKLITEKNSKALIEIDGGVDLNNYKKLVSVGADVLVAGNTVFGSANPTQTITQLKQI
jgi:ribulose-phosphate 3-epimerase